VVAGEKRPSGLVLPGSFAIVFGLLTVFSGGMALFGPEAVQAKLGDTVAYVVWFNFLAGFAYVAAGAGLLGGNRWAVGLSAGIAASTLAIFAAFGVHVVSGGAYELRTVLAMGLRSVVWLAITAIAIRKIGWR
jgi:hypothetical protein